MHVTNSKEIKSRHIHMWWRWNQFTPNFPGDDSPSATTKRSMYYSICHLNSGILIFPYIIGFLKIHNRRKFCEYKEYETYFLMRKNLKSPHLHYLSLKSLLEFCSSLPCLSFSSCYQILYYVAQYLNYVAK